MDLQPMPSKAFDSDRNLDALRVTRLPIHSTSNMSSDGTGVSFKIDHGSLAVLVGPTGCGKSTILKALLGEVDTEEGTIHKSTNMVGYCAQTPWLVNLSIRHNICGPLLQEQAIDEAWYEAVVHACCLEPDFLALPEGDLSIIGSKGLALSGGQRHRVVSPVYRPKIIMTHRNRRWLEQSILEIGYSSLMMC